MLAVLVVVICRAAGAGGDGPSLACNAYRSPPVELALCETRRQDAIALIKGAAVSSAVECLVVTPPGDPS